MKYSTVAALLLASLGALAAGCEPCLEKGQNGFSEPGPEEFQLMFSNIVSRETEIFVNDVKAGTVCQETENAVVGNFPIDSRTVIKISSLVSAEAECFVSPCCSSDCEGQVCDGDAVTDTTPFAGRVYNTAFIWMY